MKAVIFALAVLSLVSPAEAGDIKKLGTTLHGLHKDPTQDVFISVRSDGFDLLRTEERDISKSEYDKARAAATPDALPELEFSHRGTAIALEESKDSTLLAYTPIGGTEPSKWVRRSAVVVERYATDQWSDFLTAAVAEGLFQYVQHTSAYGEETELRFRRPSPASVQSPGGAINLSSDFYASMQISPSHPAFEGTHGFVILVHEPHANVVGQKVMLRGLRALRAANANRDFEFLVEGAYEGDRKIRLNGLDTALKTASGGDAKKAERLVVDLLSRHVINGPMAYRLLDDQNLPAFAIDDNDALKGDRGGAAPADFTAEAATTGRVVRAIATALEAADPETQKQMDAALLIARAYITADISDVDGQQLVDYFGGNARVFDALADIGAQLPHGAVAGKDLAFLRAQAKAYRAEQAQYAAALKRNPTMASEIARHATSSNPAVSVGFIGSFHTDGVTSLLKAAGVGYIVVEPRISGFSTDADEAAFSKMIHGESRASAIKEVLKRNSGPVAPSSAEVSSAIAKFWSHDAVVVAPVPSPPTGEHWALDEHRLSTALEANTTLGAPDIRMGAGKGGSPPPPEYASAFAFLDPPGGGRHAQLVIVDPESAKWSGDSRYEFLKNATLVPVRKEAGRESRSVVTFAQDPETKQIFSAVHDPKSNRVYFMDAQGGLDLLKQMGPPKVKEGQTVRVHMQVSAIETTTSREAT